MLPDSTQQLIQKLWELDDRGVVPWRHDQDAGDYRFRTEAYVVAVSQAPTRVRILRPDGAVVEEASEAELAATNWRGPRHNRFDAAVREMAAHAAEVTGGRREVVQTTMSALSAPARAKPLPTQAPTARRAIFGAIDSFDRSNRPSAQVNGHAEQSPPTEVKIEANVYSPWLTT